MVLQCCVAWVLWMIGFFLCVSVFPYCGTSHQNNNNLNRNRNIIRHVTINKQKNKSISVTINICTNIDVDINKNRNMRPCVVSPNPSRLSEVTSLRREERRGGGGQGRRGSPTNVRHAVRVLGM